MENIIQEFIEKTFGKHSTTPFRVYNPERMGLTQIIRIKSIEKTEKYTLIEFHYRTSEMYANGGWINIHPGSFIQPSDSIKRLGLWKAFGIPLAPKKQYFKFIWTHHTFALLFGPLPKKATRINVIESLLPGDHFNFQEVDFSNWCTIPQAIDLPISTN